MGGRPTLARGKVCPLVSLRLSLSAQAELPDLRLLASYGRDYRIDSLLRRGRALLLTPCVPGLEL